MSTDRPGRLRRALFCAASVALLALTSCGTAAEPSAQNRTSVTQAAAASGGQKVLVAVPGTLAAEYAELEAAVKGKMGMAMAPVGGTAPVTFGEWSTGPAWSTMKIPLSLATLRRNPSTNAYTMSAAITSSDNGSAEVLWQSLGTGEDAAKAVQAVLREGGDANTNVPSTRSRAEHTAFGQSEWSLADQTRFAARLPCLPQSATVLDLMSQIIPSQRWGLGAFSGAEFKGGWGPDTAGSYLVRQFGLISTPSGQVAIAFAAQADSGAFSDGMTILDKLATLVSQHVGELIGGTCPA